MREIGSEFWDVPTTSTEATIFPESTQWYLSGRSALQAIIEDISECHTVAMPSWCCDSMIKPFVNAGLAVHFYPVWFDHGIHQDLRFESDVLLLMDFFGYSVPQPDLSGYQGLIIRDVTHSILSSTYSDADYYFGSLRKWCGVWTGGYAWSRDGHWFPMSSSEDKRYIFLRKQAMEMKKDYMTGKREEKGYLEVFDQAENILDDLEMLPAAERDVELAKRLDVELIRIRRRSNAEVLRQAFPSWLLFPGMKLTDCPMFVPVLVPDEKRDKLRRYLIEHLIYCPIHWPACKYHHLTKQEKYIYDNELSLVCDQRYTEEDMNRIVRTIKQFMEA